MAHRCLQRSCGEEAADTNTPGTVPRLGHHGLSTRWGFSAVPVHSTTSRHLCPRTMKCLLSSPSPLEIKGSVFSPAAVLTGVWLAIFVCLILHLYTGSCTYPSLMWYVHPLLDCHIQCHGIHPFRVALAPVPTSLLLVMSSSDMGSLAKPRGKSNTRPNGNSLPGPTATVTEGLQSQGSPKAAPSPLALQSQGKPSRASNSMPPSSSNTDSQNPTHSNLNVLFNLPIL